jgi:hypothetical protein
MDRIMGCDHSLSRRDILKFVYCVHDTISYRIFFKKILLVACSHQGSAIILLRVA